MTPLLDHCVHLPAAQDDMFIIAQPQKMVCHCLLCLVFERHLTLIYRYLRPQEAVSTITHPFINYTFEGPLFATNLAS